MEVNVRVLVAGAGIAGLAAARGLIAAGHRVTVLERAPGLRLGGGAITLWPNGVAILGDLGVDLEGMGQRLTTLRGLTSRGRRMMEVDLEAVGRRFGAAPRVVPRGSLITTLALGLPEGTVRFDAGITRVETDPDGVRVRTESGAEYEGDFLVGADGVHSRVRAHTLGDDAVPRHGAAIWQGLTPAPFDPGSTSTLMLGRQGDFGFMGAGDGLMQWFFDVPWSADAPPEDKPVEMLRRRFAGWGPQVGQVLDSLSEGDAELFPHAVHRIPACWGRGRAVLLGDAAHGMPPVMAHGTNQAMEDVRALLGTLDEVPPPQVVDAYSAKRRAKAARASSIASKAVAVSGPRTLMQSEPVLRMSLIPKGLATRGFGSLLASLSDRI